MLVIEYQRRRMGLSQEALGNVARIHQSFISLLENGRGIPTDDQRARLSRILGVAPETLLDPVPEAALKSA